MIPSDRLNFTRSICDPDSADLPRTCATACSYQGETCVGFTTGNPPPATCCWLYDWAPSLQQSPDGDWWARPPAPPPNNATAVAAEDMFLRYVLDATTTLQGPPDVLHNISVAFRSVSGMPWPSVRKEADSWGYDWAPITQTQGVWQPLYVIGVNQVAVMHVVPQILSIPPNPTSPLVDGDNAFSINVTVVLWLPVAATISVSAAGAWPGSGAHTQLTLPLPANESQVTLTLSATDVILWWPHTHGGQALYNLTVTAQAEGAATSVLAYRHVGFRSVALVANATSEPLQQFYRVNGVELFVMGADWVPIDAFQARIDETRMRYMLGSVVAANMQILRVWGGGIYNPDLFYDLCDELGILVHSEGQFTDAVYPFDSHVLDLISSEALHQARRLSSHPSVIVWVGNNEM